MRWSVVAALGLLAGCGRGPFWEFPQEQLRTRCSAVDFLFVIDNSESMQSHQENLRASFDPFIAGIRNSLDDVDNYHVGVVTTDEYRYNTPDICRELGALVTSTGGADSSRAECGPFAEGERYMTEEDDLTEAFNCTAAVGTDGHRVESPMQAMRNVIREYDSEWWRLCNNNFLRDESLLVSVIITDEWDGPDDPSDHGSSGDPQSWYNHVVQAKGTEENAVVVSLINEAGTGCNTTAPAFDGRNIAEFTDLFTHGFVGGICNDYAPIFASAVDAIDDACTDYVYDAVPPPE